MRLNFLIIPLSIVMLFIAGCSDHDDDYVPPPVTLNAIQLTIDNTQLPIGISHAAVAIGYYSDGTTESGIAYHWGSNNSDIATVDASGVVTGISVGNTQITVDEQGVESAIDISITAAVPQSIEIFPGQKTVSGGLAVPYQAIALYSDQEYYDITLHERIIWESDNLNVASFTGTDGIAHTTESGEAHINVDFEGLSAITTATLVTTDATLTDVVITPETNAVVPNGQAISFIATAFYSNDISNVISSSSVWASVNDSIIKPTEQAGYFTGVSVGNTSVTAEFGGITATLPVEVTMAEFESVEIQPSEGTYPELISTPFTASAEFIGGISFDLTNQKNAFWQSSDHLIATVALNGLVSMVSPGDVTISFTYRGITEEAMITVTKAVLTSISVHPLKDYFVGEGHTRQLSATGSYDNGTSHVIDDSPDLKWVYVYDDHTKGQVTPKGLVTNHATADPITSYFNVEARMDGIRGTSLANFGATEVLTNNENTLSFIGPFTDVDAGLLYFDDFDNVNMENSTTGPEESSFILLSLQQATNLCENLVYDGYDNYRLPTYVALQALWGKYDNADDDNYKIYTEQKWAVGQPFWSNTYTEGGERNLVDLSNGNLSLSADPAALHYATCVRDVVSEG